VTEPAERLTLPDLLRRRAARHAKWVALDANAEDQLTYAEWDRRSNALARGLAGLGVGRGSRVGLYLGPTEWLDYAVASLAVHKCAGTVFHLNEGLGEEEISRRAAQCQATGVLRGTGDPGSQVSFGDGIWTRRVRDVSSGDDSPFDLGVTPDDYSDILYTSGSTGHPKAVLVPHCNTTFGRGPEGFDQFRDPKPMVVPMMLGTNASATILHIALALPTTLVLCPAGDPDRMALLTAQRQATTMMVNPQIALSLLRMNVTERYDLSHVRTLASAAAPLSRAVALDLLAAFPGAAITTTFTSAESVPAAIVGTYDVDEPTSLGRPVRGTEVIVTDEDGKEVPAGELGEIRVKCPAPQRRYLDNPAANARVYVDGWVRTGDLARLAPDGRLLYFDRASEAVRTADGLVSTVPVEAALYAYPRTSDASVVSVALPGSAADVVAVGVVLGPGGSVDELRAHLDNVLEPHERPAILESLPRLPRSQNGKVLKQKLRAQLSVIVQDRREEPVSTRITASFKVDSYDEQPMTKLDGAELSSAEFRKTFTGGLEGTSTVHSVIMKTPVQNAMSYVAFEHVTGKAGNREGTFVIRHATLMTPQARSGEWLIIPHSGTGGFAGVTGTGTIIEGPDGQTLQLDCNFDD
jgi:fatty-acyl-CoA synthase